MFKIRYTFITSDTTAGDAVDFSNADQDVFIKKIIFGDPDNGDILFLYNKVGAYGHTSGMGSVDTDELALSITQPTAAAGLQLYRVVDLAGEFNPGLQLNGGCVHTDGDHITIIWDDK